MNLMKLQHEYIINTFLLFLFTILFTNCVSVQLPTAKVHKSKEVIFQSPNKDFEIIKSPASDMAWLSSKSGNTISYLSECENPADPTLKQIESDTISGLGSVQIQSSKNWIYNGREAITSEAAGNVDGVSVRIQFIVFKKNGCNYTLTYGGVAKNFSNDISEFEKFVSNFKIP